MSPAGEAGDADDLFDAFLAASRAFLAAPSLTTMRVLTARYALYYVARTGSRLTARQAEAGLEPLLEAIEANARNIIAGRP